MNDSNILTSLFCSMFLTQDSNFSALEVRSEIFEIFDPK
jgi:hypothetical protein